MVQWLQTHQEWLALIILIVAFLESLVVVGILLPGVVMLFAAASLAGGGALDVGTMLVAGFVGAVLGDGASFVVGQIFHERIRGWWPFRSHPQWLEQGEVFFARYGGVSIALGRFVGPIRPVIPVVAGMMGMPARYFYLVNILSAVVWSPAYLLPGYFVGASLHWQNHLSPGISGILAGACILAVLLSYSGRFILNRVALSNRSLVTRRLVKIVCGLTGAFMAVSALNVLPVTEQVNQVVQDWMQLNQTSVFDRFFSVITWVGSFKVLLPVIVMGSFWLYRDGYLKQAVVFFLIAIGLRGVFKLFKWVFASVRPETALASSFSYPSGHAAMVMFMGLWMSWYFSRVLPSRYSLWVWSFGLIAAFVTGLSRMYLGEHWAADVLGGAVLGILGFSVWLLFEQRSGLEQETPVAVKRANLWWRASQLVIVLLLSFLLLAR